jgi:DNA polymerase III subunit delta'
MNFVGNQKIVKILERQIEKGRLAQSYLFCGPENVGKKTLALQIACKISGKKSSEINSDVVLIEPEIQEKKGIKKILDIKIEKIRELQHQIALHSQGGKERFFIIDDAERMTKSAQNALLKILEEPNEKAVIILVSKDEKKLLPTIISRCQKIKFGLVSEEELVKMIPEERSDDKAFIFWAMNRPGQLLHLLEDPMELEFRKKTFEEFKLIFNGNVEEKFSLAENLSKDEEIILKKLDIWLILLRKSMLGIDEKIKITPLKSFKIIEKIISALETLRETNANSRLVLENVFLEF